MDILRTQIEKPRSKGHRIQERRQRIVRYTLWQQGQERLPSPAAGGDQRKALPLFISDRRFLSAVEISGMQTLIEKQRSKGRESLAEGSVSSVIHTWLTGSRRSPRPELPGRKIGKRARSLYQAQNKCLVWRTARMKPLIENWAVATFRSYNLRGSDAAPPKAIETSEAEASILQAISPDQDIEKRIKGSTSKDHRPVLESHATARESLTGDPFSIKEFRFRGSFCSRQL